MSVRDLSSIFSRYFFVGFYFPAFFGLVALAVDLPPPWAPEAIRLQHLWHARGTEFAHPLLAMAALAIPLALLLSGIAEGLFRLYRDLPLFSRPRWLVRLLSWLQRRRRARLLDDAYRGEFEEVRNRAATTLLERLPARGDDIRPNRLANVQRAWEEYPVNRWGLDPNVIQHHLPYFYADGEATLLDDARTQVAFALNLALLFFLVGLTAASWIVWSRNAEGWRWLEMLRLLPVAVAYLVYRSLAIEALVLHRGRLRAALDLHRLDLFKSLGVGTFTSFSDDERTHGEILSDFLLYGRRDDLSSFGRDIYSQQAGSQPTVATKSAKARWPLGVRLPWSHDEEK